METDVQCERDLWAAVMMEAIGSLDAKSKNQRKEAKEWFESESTGVGTFLWVCAALNIPPTSVLRRIRHG